VQTRHCDWPDKIREDLAKQVFPSEDTIWIDGGTVSTEDDFSQVSIEALDLFQATSRESSSGTDSKIGAKGTAGDNFLIAKGSAELASEIGSAQSSSLVTNQTLSSRVAALVGLKKCRIPLVVDDFHYIPREMQGSIVRALKPLIFEGLAVVIIAIPHRRYDALKVEKEMTGRISPIEIQPWSKNELIYIPETGFGLLNYSLADSALDRLASEAIGALI
jgi:hypothetical protein